MRAPHRFRLCSCHLRSYQHTLTPCYAATDLLPLPLQVQQLLGCKEAAAKLASLQQRRRQLTEQRAALLEAIAPLELRLARAKQAADSRLARLQGSIDELSRGLGQLLQDEASSRPSSALSHNSDYAASTASVPVSVSAGTEEEQQGRRAAVVVISGTLADLQGQEASLQRQVAAAKAGEGLLDAAERAELERGREQLESLDAQLQYMAREVEACEQVGDQGWAAWMLAWQACGCRGCSQASACMVPAGPDTLDQLELPCMSESACCALPCHWCTTSHHSGPQ
jgi:hypothetical protein